MAVTPSLGNCTDVQINQAIECKTFIVFETLSFWVLESHQDRFNYNKPFCVSDSNLLSLPDSRPMAIVDQRGRTVLKQSRELPV